MRTAKVVGIGVVPPLEQPIYRPSPKDPPYNPDRRNLCVDCGEDFASVEAFDRHRWGPQSRRKCVLAGLELVAGAGVRLAMPIFALRRHRRPELMPWPFP